MHSLEKIAENTAQYCRKGSLVGITGRIQTRNYDNKEGKRVYVTDVLAETIKFLDQRRQTVHTNLQNEPNTATVVLEV